ncbi:Bug family tripartite tricarboxylate transporter substrate binding protein [Bordetella sp. 02P26C-1]|uniref:Bug family tripartite tricarboxylate transporter substrate binding protein n=1 Tax=Bordetella sp. 02P26C-1 TaxID=2683195 RepID=UPI001353F11C|nr:tripartite tricarboxylate transporter substrate binding protein [Bordetella sp. 02P26C-1]MVW77642.1 tripartite tricarboxylate transporter substrate binding protein [Bordetella sp. 02P26C-1]
MKAIQAKRWLTALSAFGITAATLIGPVAAADYPDRPITLVVGFSPGGSNDITARVIAQPLSELLGVPVAVENRVGAAGVISTQYISRATPDGYTLGVTSASPLVLTPHTLETLPYDAKKDFTAISLLGITPETVAVNPKVPAANLEELVKLAQTRDVTLASSGTGGLPHMAIEMFKRAALGTRIVHVPYKGAAPAVTDVMAGHVEGVVVDLPAVSQQITSGRLRGLAIANDQRSAFLPDLPTADEQGVKNFVAVNWIGVIAPAQTPEPIIDKLHDALTKVMQLPKVQESLAKAAVQPSVSASPGAFKQFIEAEDEKWAGIVKASGVKAE